MEHSDSLSNLLKALAAAQAEMDNPPNDSANPHFRSKYASLAAVRNAVIPPLAAHGLSVMQFPTPDGELIHCETILAHESGEYIRHSLSLPSQATQQGYMGGATYAKRMALLALFVIAGDEDDDAETAMGRSREGQRQKDREKHPDPGRMLGHSREATQRKTEAQVNRTTGEVVEKEQSPEELAREALVSEIARGLKSVVVAQNHAGLYKAILHHCFEAEHYTLQTQPVAILDAGMPLFRHLCEALDAKQWERSQHPDEWIAQEQRKLAALARGDAPADEEAPAEDGATGPSWGPGSANLMQEEEEEDAAAHVGDVVA